MAKGQSRRNREVRKPKVEKPAPPAPVSTFAKGNLSALNTPKKK
jgi:hypothetical protein